LDVYSRSKGFPREENIRFDKPDAASVGFDWHEHRRGLLPEGQCGDGSFLQMAMGSASELEYQLLLARDLDYLQNPEYERLTAQAVEVKADALVPDAESEGRSVKTEN